MNKCKNGLYITNEDFESFQDSFSHQINSYEKIYNEKPLFDVENLRENSRGIGVRSKNITFVVTENCNLNCTYCYETHKTKRRMSKKVAKDAVDFIFDKSKINGYYDTDISKGLILDFIGGEPLLEIDLIDYIVDYFKFKAFESNSPWSTNYMISITTNGILYNTEKVQKFLKKNEGRVSVGITIDGNKKLHDSCRLFPDGSGSYDIVEKSIKTWLKNQDLAQTKITLCPSNVMYLNDALKNVWSLGITGAFTNCVFEPGWTKKDAKILYEQMIELADYLLKDKNYEKYYCSLFDEKIGTELFHSDNWCGGNGEMLAIGTDGTCYPCIRFMKYALSQPNRKEQPIGDIWKGLDKKEDNKWLLELKKVDMVTQCQYEDNKKCLTCPIAQGCSLCTGFNYDYFGTPNHKATFICDTHKARVLANVYYWNKLYEQVGINKHFKMNIPKEWALELVSEDEYYSLQLLSQDLKGWCDSNCSGCEGSCFSCTGCQGCTDNCCGTCSRSCSGCGSSCSRSCSGCSSCIGACSSECSGCSGCSSSCTGGCSGGCNKSCNGCSSGCSGCSGCGGCDSGCSGCSGTCKNSCGGCDSGCSGSCTGGCKTSCTGKCDTTCSGGCKTSCTSCSDTCTGKCTGTCKVECDNACTSSSASTVISNLGVGKVIKGNEISDIQKYITNEYKRRSLTTTDNNYDINKIDYHKKLFSDIKGLDSSFTESIKTGDLIKADPYNKTADILKNKMLQNLRKEG